MCGIAGFSGAPDPGLLRELTGALVHRGPDDEGFLEDRDVSLGMRRLSIVDLPGGRQPISSEDGRVTVVFNGEIYNHKALRAELQAKGHRFKTHSDTEAIVHLYEELGPACVDRLRGMFAFAAWDRGERRLFIARDRLGIKPLYYAELGGRLYFASELRALLRVPGLSRELDPAAVRQYADLLYVASPRTLLRDARKLEPGSSLSWRAGKLELKRYWRPELRPREQTEAEALGALDAALGAAVEEQKAADVPLGLFLSGGLDSSLLAAYLARSGRPPAAYCLSTGHPAYDETEKARSVAKHLGLDFHEVPVSAEPDLDAFLDAVDEPLADSSAIATYWVSKAGRKSLKVALTGVGGDELFGGYPRYLGASLHSGWTRLPGGLRRALARAGASIPDSVGSRNVGGWARRFLEGGRRELPEAYRYWMGHAERGLFSPALGPAGPDPVLAAFEGTEALDPVARATQADLSTYLSEDLLALADRASMAAGLELRVPLLDERVVELACAWPTSLKLRGRSLKHLQKTLLSRSLPRDIIEQKKRGFMVPMGPWLRGPLREAMEDALSESAVRRRGLFRLEAVARLKQEHLSGRRERPDLLWALMLLELWQRRHSPQSRWSAAPPKLRLLVLSDFQYSDSEGGAGRVALETARDLARRGHEVACWAPGPEGSAPEERDGRLTLFRTPEGLAPASAAATPSYLRRLREDLGRTLRGWKPDTLLAHQPRALWLARGLEAAEELPAFYFFHSCWGKEHAADAGPWGRAGSGLREAVERSVLGRAAGAAVLSAYMAHELRGHGFDPRRIRRLPPGVDLERFRPSAGRRGPGLRLLTLRNLRARMGLENLLTAMALLSRELPDLSLTLAGTGPLEGALKADARRLGLDGRVLFPGRVPEPALPELYRSCDLFVLPSREQEGLGLVLLEALASGLPAVGTPVGGIPEVLEGLDPGWIADGTSAEELAAVLRRGAEAAAGGRSSEACRAYAERYPWSGTGAALEGLLYAFR